MQFTFKLAVVVGVCALTACSLLPTTSPQMSAAKPMEMPGDCESLSAKLGGLPQTRIESILSVPANSIKVEGFSLPAHCVVKGAMNERKSLVDGLNYAIKFEMRLPIQWNGRFWYQANGGIDGTVIPATGEYGGGAVTSALTQGFAVISSDAGHDNRVTRGPGFGVDPQARLDYGYQAVGRLTPMAKSLIQKAYGKAPDRSYIGGCSNGGRHVMVAATRYPEQFDGYLMGAPGYKLPLAAIANIFGAKQYAKVATDPNDLSTAFTDAERQMVVAKVLEKCDALDGLKDGMIQDIAQCQSQFQLERDVPTCQGARNGSCLSAEQKKAIAPIFSGATTEDGKPFYSRFPVDAGLADVGVKYWEFTAPFKLDSGAIGLIWSVPPQDPQRFNPTQYVLETPISELLKAVQSSNATYTESALSFMMPVQPENLDKLRDRGAKIVAYHGNSDAIFSSEDTARWYEGLQSNNGGKADVFARYFPVPGMNHCRGGASADQFDMISPLVKWVEEGIAPKQVISQVRGEGNPGGANAEIPTNWTPTRTRPLCPYPQVARYTSGNSENASSFQCQ
jgi:hypothetical protein